MSFLDNITNGIGKVTDAIGSAFNPISSLIGVGASLFENSANRKAQEKANQTNMQIAQMNNQFNERMMEKQMAYNTDMWNKENAYNTAASQVQRLKDAGLNPYMALSGSSSAGMATGANGVTAPTAQAANVQAYNSGGQITQALQQGYLADLATQKQKVDINVLQQQMQLKTLETMSEIANKRWDTMTKKEQAKWQYIQNTFAHDLHQTEIDNRRIQYQIMFEQSKQAAAEATMAILRAQNFPEILANEIANQGAELALLSNQGRLSDISAKVEFRKIALTEAQAEGIKLDNKLVNEMWDSLTRRVELESYQIAPILDALTTTFGNILNYRGMKSKTTNNYKYQTNNIYN